ncbi:DUF72 domain-containing protein [Methanosarcina sp. 2.H.A.1B.4]|uniref:DUF72 domain-containing protein n=1 Tax=Methanosarcina sp. 2.H.A.1B.4 TaxID=1483600 RepID=UPI0006222B3C|nr:DUF72 domain-containing protein [Methanosarcina sp. 2.H.A.1B.4]KKG12064.1 hypothetical protein EO92_06890 [Methanosarcina sp. 2.H.A.1B.4]
MQAFVGTSGWYYEWNEEKSLDWFVRNSKLNAVELNASFYRFPSLDTIKNWSVKGAGLRWSVKAHMSVTHKHQFNERAFEIWNNFRERFEPLDPLIDFYLFQTPPKFKDIGKVLDFAKATGLGKRFALEIRNREMLGDEELCATIVEKVTPVSVDSPDFRDRIFPGKIVYLRMHGRDGWYCYAYSGKEMRETARKILEAGPEKAYVYFNNDHNMLKNARMMLDIVNELST